MLTQPAERATTGVFGIGVDLAFVPEFRVALEDKKSVFVRDFLTAFELAYCLEAAEPLRSQRVAARYAAKEALLKALDGPRLFEERRLRFDFAEAEVRNDDQGRPFFRFRGALAEFLESIGISQTRVSLSHTGDYAMASVILL